MDDINFKFPSTPHFYISTATDVRNDKILGMNDKKDALKNELVIEEKIDGANLGISFDYEANLILQNRGTILTPPFFGQWKTLNRWLSSKSDILFDILSDKYILFGEWCYAMHSIHYTSLPDYFLAFDIYDKPSEIFVDFDKRNQLIGKIGVSAVPFIAKGFYSLDDLPRFIKKSLYSDSIAEGIYVRASNSEKTFFRAKIVRDDFTQNINQHWSSRLITKNKLLLHNNS
ncbi:DNA ligase [Serratia marcescens]|uniref:RNA ligase family protein n=1 Tax=Serratia marcescens TaxID=615 RepID=UPI0010374867|nr:RNA ligase family protein [Serratia marcescens]TBU69199.1 DNA ligase [Serratia marcescens]